MKEINLYIAEKFKISKDIENISDKQITELISKIFHVENKKKLINIINNWIVTNNVEGIEVLYQKSNPKSKNLVKVRDENYISSNTEISFGVFLKYFNEYFGKDIESQNKCELYSIDSCSLFGNSKALAYLTLTYNYIIVKKETI